MFDKYGREIDYIRISVTDRCNLRCLYCMPEEGVSMVSHEEILSYDEIVTLAEVFASLGIRKIKLTGGEPLVRKDCCDLVKRIRKIPGIETVTITTNGILLADNLDRLAEAGIDGINISLDTLDPDRYRELTGGGEIGRGLEGLDLAAAAHIPAKINAVSLDLGEQNWKDLLELGRERPVDVRFIEMMPIGMGKVFSGKSGDEICTVLEKHFGEPKRYTEPLGNGPAVYVQFPGFRARIGFISAVSHQFCDSCNRIRLTSTGVLKPCLQYGGGTDIRGLMRSGAEDAQIKTAMRRAIYRKPARHHFADGEAMTEEEKQSLEKSEMSRIGG